MIMQDSACANYRQMLSEKKRELLVDLGVKFDAIALMGRVAEEDQAQMSHDEHIHLSRNQHQYEVLKMIDEAVDRLEAGDFGVCMRCEEQIPVKRLQVLPWAKYCVRCQERVSARELAHTGAAHHVWTA